MKEEIERAIRAIAMVGMVLLLFSAVAVADVGLNVPMYDQGDKIWSDDQLGDCKDTTIGSAGCAITSIAMVFKYYGIDTNPQDMNNWLKNNEGYNPGGCYVKWKTAQERSNGTVRWIDKYSTDLNRIKSELDNGYPVIAEVRILTKGGEKTQHFVVITGYSDSESKFYINDPVGGLEITIPGTRYPGDPEKEIKGIRLYHGSLIQIADQSISPTIAKPGDELTFVYKINNPYLDEVPKIRLGAQVRTNSPQGVWIDDVSNDKVIDLASGTNDYSRVFRLSSDSGAGFYDARWVVIDELTKKPINSKEMIRIFEVQEESPPTQPKLDLIFLIDTTGSMGDDIDQVKASANEIVEALNSEELDYRIAIADYRDYPCCGWGETTDYVYKLDLPFTTRDDKQDIIDAIDDLVVDGGADWEESVYSALVESMLDENKDLANSANSGWRNGVTKVIIIMGDAPPHIPEPWGGYTLQDVISVSESIDPVIVYSIVIGSSESTYDAFAEISAGTNGKVYSSPTADDIVATIIEVIGDIGETPETRGVFLNITPSLSETMPGNSASYSVNITNMGNIADIYNVSLELENFGFQRGYPVAIQPSWVIFNSAEVTLNPEMSEVRSLAITVPENWAGMEDVIYGFDVTATSTMDTSIGNTSSAELKVKADKRSMVEYSKLEIQWLIETVEGSDIDRGIKNSMLKKLTNAESKLDQALVNLDNGKIKPANNMLWASRNLVNAFNNQVDAQYDKKIMQPDAIQLEERADQIMEDIEKARNS